MADKQTGIAGIVAGFKEFVLRGNVIDLAVAVVVGGAFTALVKAFTDSIVYPIIAAAGGEQSIGLGFSINGQFVNIGAVLTALITFLITMLVLYFVFVVPLNKLRERRATGEEPEPEAPAEDILLLTEIRDLLRQQQGPQ